MATRFGGVWPAVLTPVSPDGAPNLPVLEQLTDLFARQKLGGLYLTGSTGQWPLYTAAERKAMTEVTVKAAAGRIPVMSHVGAATTAEAVDLARYAAKVGATAVSAVGPTYYSHPVDAVFEHYRQIGAATDLPLYVYHLSGVSQMNLSPLQYVERVMQIPNVGGMKITDANLYPFGVMHGAAGDKLQLFSGADEVMCHAILSGAIGAIGTFYNLWGTECHAAREKFIAGDVGYATRFMLRFQRAIFDALAGGSWQFLRSAMRMKHNIDVGMPRPPLGIAEKPWADAEVRRLLELVEKEG